jgi:hypothetical protein
MSKVVLLGISIIALGLALNYVITTTIYWLIAWSFNLTFSWKLSVGIWVISTAVAGLLNSLGGRK